MALAFRPVLRQLLGAIKSKKGAIGSQTIIKLYDVSVRQSRLSAKYAGWMQESSFVLRIVL